MRFNDIRHNEIMHGKHLGPQHTSIPKMLVFITGEDVCRAGRRPDPKFSLGHKS